MISHRGHRGRACPGGSPLCLEQTSDGGSGQGAEHRGGEGWLTGSSEGFLEGPTAKQIQTLGEF